MDALDYRVWGAGFIIYVVNYGIGFPDNNPNNEDPTLELRIYFNGGGQAQITVNYYEGGSKVFYIYDTGPGQKIYIWH